MNTIEITKNKALATITINKPEKHNCLNSEEINFMISTLEDIQDDENICVLLLTGIGEKTFCSGASFEHLKDGSLRGDAFSTLAKKIQKLSIPSICLVNGSVYGGGVELALACDFRCGVEGTYLQVPIAKLGLSYSSYGLKLYQAKLGLSISKRILLLCEKLSSQELHHLGFFDYLQVDLAAAKSHCNELVNTISASAPLAIKVMRETLNDLSMQEYDNKKFIQQEENCFSSKDREEGFNAILEKRIPLFKGK